MAKLETSYTSQPAGVTPRAPSGQTDEVQPSHRFMQYAVMAPRWDPHQHGAWRHRDDARGG